MESTTKKDSSVETLRGIAIILVVVGHVIGSASDGGMQVPDNSIMRYLYYTFIECIQMPLFTVIAGWVYAFHPIKPGKIPVFINKKIYRILVPMFVVGISYFLLQYMVPGTNKKGDIVEIWKIFIFPYTLYWYLYSLFLVFVLIVIVDIKETMKQFSGWFLVLLLSFILLLLRDYMIPVESLDYLSYKGSIYLLPFFILGIGILRFSDVFQNKILLWVTSIIFMATTIIQQLAWFKIIEFAVVKDNLTGLLMGTSGTILLISAKWQIKWLIWIGKFSFSIFLFHAFGTAGGRIILKAVGINSEVVIFITSLAFGIFLPIIVDRILDNFRLTRFLFLGRQTINGLSLNK